MKKLLLAFFTVSMIFSFAACASEDASNTITSESSKIASTPETPAVVEEEAAEEIEEAAIEEDGQRVVALSVAIVEILDALEVPMVGVPTSSYTLPDSTKDATAVGNPMAPDLEVIKSLNPSMVFSVLALEASLKSEFEAVNIDSTFVNLNNFNGLLESIKTIGESTGRIQEAQELIKDMEDRVNAVSAGIEGREQPSVMLIFGVSGSFQVGTENSYVGDLIKRAGGINIITDVEAGFIPVDMEYLASKNPEYILLMTHANPEESKAAFEKEFEENATWDNFDAVKNDKVIALETEYFGMSANLLAADAIEKLEAIFYE